MKMQLYSNKNKENLIDNIIQVEIEEINNDICPNDSLEQIIADEVLSYAEQSRAMECLEFCCQKLRIGGTLIVKDLEIDVLCRGTFQKKITQESFNAYTKNRSNIHSVHDIKKFILSRNLNIDNVTISGNKYTLYCNKK
jgi:hypothetical protein